MVPLRLSTCVLVLHLPVFSAATVDSLVLKEAQSALLRLAEKHRAAKTVRIRFETMATGPDGEPLPKTGGQLLASDSGRFRLEHARGTVACDGRTVWHYSPANRQAIVKNAAEVIPSGGAAILFRTLEARPLRATREKKMLRVALDPESTGESLDSLILVLHPGIPELRRVETVDPYGARIVYVVQSVRLEARVRAGDFSFAPPSGAEVVDMR